MKCPLKPIKDGTSIYDRDSCCYYFPDSVIDFGECDPECAWLIRYAGELMMCARACVTPFEPETVVNTIEINKVEKDVS